MSWHCVMLMSWCYVGLQAAFLLGEVLQQHPRMAAHVVREVERFMFRPGLAPRARYTAIICLNQLQLSHNPALGGCLLAAAEECHSRWQDGSAHHGQLAGGGIWVA